MNLKSLLKNNQAVLPWPNTADSKINGPKRLEPAQHMADMRERILAALSGEKPKTPEYIDGPKPFRETMEMWLRIWRKQKRHRHRGPSQGRAGFEVSVDWQ